VLRFAVWRNAELRKPAQRARAFQLIVGVRIGLASRANLFALYPLAVNTRFSLIAATATLS
jgi:hypothetical protein